MMYKFLTQVFDPCNCYILLCLTSSLFSFLLPCLCVVFSFPSPSLCSNLAIMWIVVFENYSTIVSNILNVKYFQIWSICCLFPCKTLIYCQNIVPIIECCFMQLFSAKNCFVGCVLCRDFLALLAC